MEVMFSLSSWFVCLSISRIAKKQSNCQLQFKTCRRAGASVEKRPVEYSPLKRKTLCTAHLESFANNTGTIESIVLWQWRNYL